MKPVNTNKAPAAIGPYSQALEIESGGKFIFTSGQIPLDPATGQMITGDITEQTKRVFENLKAILNAADADFNNVIKTTVFLASMNDFQKMNEVYALYFGEHKPARSTVAVAKLPKNAKIEIEAIAVIKN